MKRIVKKEVEVFDLGKFIEDCLKTNRTYECISSEIKEWACEYDGLTKEEIANKYRYGITSGWCVKKDIEVEEEVEISDLCSDDEKVLLRNLKKHLRDGYICRESCGDLSIYLEEPCKSDCNAWIAYTNCNIFEFPYDHLFTFIHWKDKDPYKISDLLGNEDETN